MTDPQPVRPHRHGHPTHSKGHRDAAWAHDHASDDHDHGAHGERGAVEIAAASPPTPGKLHLSPFASDATRRMLKTAIAVGLLWVAVAWALGWGA